jgi:hypothetical protein
MKQDFIAHYAFSASHKGHISTKRGFNGIANPTVDYGLGFEPHQGT